MWPHNQRWLLRDRAADPRPLPWRAKRAILGRGTQRGLALLALVLIVYGTLGPLGLHGQRWIDRTATWRWLPPLSHSDANDVFTNIVVYIPVGLCWRLLVRRRGRAGWVDLLAAWTLSIGLSYTTELAQQFMPARSANLRDVGVNAGAALLGCLLAPAVQRWLRTTHSRAYHARQGDDCTPLAWAAVLVVSGLMVMPIHPLRAHPAWEGLRPLDWQDARRTAMFVALGYCLMGAALQRCGSRRAAWCAALLLTAPLAIGLELAQAYIATHACGLIDICTTLLGGTLGCAIAAHWTTGLPRVSFLHMSWTAFIRRMSPILILIVGCAAVSLRAGAAGAPSGTVNWMPFQTQFGVPFHHALVDLAELAGVYGLLALLCLTYGSRGEAPALLLVIGLSTLVEAQRALRGATADSTPILIAGLAWVAAVRVSRALRPLDRAGGDAACAPVWAEAT